jgi:hypothetical protein
MIRIPIYRIGVVSPEKNLKRHTLAMSQGVDTLKTAPSAPPSDSLLSNEPQFEASRRRAGLPGNVSASILCPFTPPNTFWRDGARSGQGFEGEITSIPLRPRLSDYNLCSFSFFNTHFVILILH